MSAKFFYPQDRRGAALKAKRGGNKEAVGVVGELFEGSLRSIKIFKNNVVPAYAQAQKKLARMYEACDCKEKKNVIASTMMRNGLAVSLAFRQIDRGERYSRLDPDGSAKGATRRPKKGEPDHKRGYTGISFDDCRLAAEDSCHKELSRGSYDKIYMFTEAIRDEAEDIFKGVKEMPLSELRVSFSEIEFGVKSIVPINGDTTSPFGTIAPTIPTNWSAAQFACFFSDMTTSGAVFGPEQPGEDKRNRLVPPPGKNAFILLRKKVMMLAAPNKAGTSSSSRARDPKRSGEATSGASNDVKPRPGKKNQQNGKGGKCGGGRLKGAKSNNSTKNERRNILEDTDEESGSDEPAEQAAKKSGKQSQKQSRKESTAKPNLAGKPAPVTKHTNTKASSRSGKDSSKGAKCNANSSDPLKGKVNPGHMTTIKTFAPKVSETFRCLSVAEGCHVLESVEPKVRSLEYPPETMVECSQFMRTQLIQKDEKAFGSMRLGLIQFISIVRSNSDEEVKPLTGSDGRAVILVMKGKVSSLLAGEWQVWAPDTPLITRLADALVFNYFPAKKFHQMPEFSARFNIIHAGFKETGLTFTKCLGDSQATCHLRPEYCKDFHHSHSATSSLDHALRLYLGLGRSVIPPGIGDGMLRGDTLVDTLATVEKHIIGQRKSFSLMVIANLPLGLSVIYGEKPEAICTKSTCVLYLHDARSPTIAHYYHDLDHFALLREISSPSGVPYNFHGFEKYLDPTLERTTPCDFRAASTSKKIVTLNITFPPPKERHKGKSIPELLGMTKKERKAVPPLDSSVPFTVPQLGRPSFDSKDDIQKVQDMNKYVTDEHVLLLMMG